MAIVRVSINKSFFMHSRRKFPNRLLYSCYFKTLHCNESIKPKHQQNIGSAVFTMKDDYVKSIK